ncbi:MAG: ABC transporter substrate-binding protein [Nocardioidaceae bacterium]
MLGNKHKVLAIGGAAAVIASLAACGSSTSSTGSGPGTADVKGQPVVLGTTETVTSLDPAGSYDLGSWTLQYSMFQTLLTIPAGQNTPQGDAAKSCSYQDPKTFTCTLKPGLKFSNGDPLTSKDVKWSLERNIKIADPNGASGLLASIANKDSQGNLTVNPKAIDTPNPTTVVFHLSHPDTTFQFVLTTPASDIVDHKVYPFDKKMSGTTVVGSGPYELSKYQAGQQASFVPNPNYTGANKAQAPQFLVQYYQESSALKLAVQNGEVDIAWRSLSPQDVNNLKSDSKVTVAQGAGSEIRYWVWKVDGPVGKNLAVRQAAAYLINRDEIAKTAYDGTVVPLYSIVPPGFPGQTDAFKAIYGATPNKTKAAQVLKAAGIKTPVQLTIGYTPSHYGPNAVDEATQVQRQLNSSGLFNVQIKSAEWTQYQTLYKQNAYDMYILGWFPDFLDADNYLAPFLVDGGFYANGYTNAQANKLVADEEGTSNAARRQSDFEQLQKIAARDVPFIPSWVGKNTAVYGPGVKGVEGTLDPSFIFRFWKISKGA